MARTKKVPPEPAPEPAKPEGDDPNEEPNDDDDLFSDESVGPPEDPNPTGQPAGKPAVYGPGVRPPSDEDRGAVEYYKAILNFSDDAAYSLAYDQQLSFPTDFLELDDDDIDAICQAIRKPGGIGTGSQVAVISVTRLKLTLFYIKLNARMSRISPGFDGITKYYLELVKDQRNVEIEYAKTKSSPDPKPLQLDLATAPACFEKVKTLLGALQGATGTLLQYVIREDIHALKEGRSSPFGKWKHRHSTIDMELIDRAPILASAADLTMEDSVLEAVGPFSSPFSIDMKTVWNILFAMFGLCESSVQPAV